MNNGDFYFNDVYKSYICNKYRIYAYVKSAKYTHWLYFC